MATNQVEEKPLDCSTRDAIADGLVDLLKPSVEEIDGRVKTVRSVKIMSCFQDWYVGVSDIAIGIIFRNRKDVLCTDEAVVFYNRMKS